MKTLSISDIRDATLAESPHFFSRDTLRFFGQRMSSFRVWKGKSGAYYIAAPSYFTDHSTGNRRFVGISFRKFTGSDLSMPEHPKFHTMEDVREWVKTQG